MSKELSVGGLDGTIRVLLDDEDYEWAKNFSWSAFKTRSGKIYVGRGQKGETILLHRAVARTPKGMVTDHINGNTLDNRKENLRHATYRQNQANSRTRKINSSGFPGVSFWERPQLWVSQIQRMVDGKKVRVHFRYHRTKEQAMETYVNASVEQFGEFIPPHVKEYLEQQAALPKAA
jgi:hypothetical protein